MGIRLVFGANDGSTGRELWVTDGTTAGTTLLKDINPGPGSSSPRDFAALSD
jgi:ELWxxDGT repeat protein